MVQYITLNDLHDSRSQILSLAFGSYLHEVNTIAHHKLAVPVHTLLLHPVSRHTNRNNYPDSCKTLVNTLHTKYDQKLEQHLTDITDSNKFKKESTKHYLKR